MMAKSLEMCASASHQTAWRYFDEGKLFDDQTFSLKEQCKIQPDFGTAPVTPTSTDVSNMLIIKFTDSMDYW